MNQEVLHGSTSCSFTNREQFLPLMSMVMGGRIQTWVFSNQLPLGLMFSKSKMNMSDKEMKELQIGA